jgi:hypothetical protein
MQHTNYSPFLTDAEVAEICAPLVMPAAQRRYLKRLGLLVQAKPNGRPLVARGEVERVLVGRRPEGGDRPAHPNRTALFEVIDNSRQRRRGPPA